MTCSDDSARVERWKRELCKISTNLHNNPMTSDLRKMELIRADILLERIEAAKHTTMIGDA